MEHQTTREEISSAGLKSVDWNLSKQQQKANLNEMLSDHNQRSFTKESEDLKKILW